MCNCHNDHTTLECPRYLKLNRPRWQTVDGPVEFLDEIKAAKISIDTIETAKRLTLKDYKTQGEPKENEYVTMYDVSRELPYIPNHLEKDYEVTGTGKLVFNTRPTLKTRYNPNYKQELVCFDDFSGKQLKLEVKKLNTAEFNLGEQENPANATIGSVYGDFAVHGRLTGTDEITGNRLSISDRVDLGSAQSTDDNVFTDYLLTYFSKYPLYGGNVEPSLPNQFVTKKYVDEHGGGGGGTDPNAVHKTGNEEISGIKTFLTLPQSSLTPSLDTEFATKKYVDDHSGGGGKDPDAVHKTGHETIDGIKTFVTLPQSSLTPSLDTEFTTKKYVDEHTGQAYDPLAVHMHDTQNISGLKTFLVLPQSSIVPTLDEELVNKKYVDDHSGGGGTDPNAVHKTGNEEISGIKTFLTLPQSSLTPSLDSELITLKFFKDNAAEKESIGTTIIKTVGAGALGWIFDKTIPWAIAKIAETGPGQWISNYANGFINFFKGLFDAAAPIGQQMRIDNDLGGIGPILPDGNVDPDLRIRGPVDNAHPNLDRPNIDIQNRDNVRRISQEVSDNIDNEASMDISRILGDSTESKVSISAKNKVNGSLQDSGLWLDATDEAQTIIKSHYDGLEGDERDIISQLTSSSKKDEGGFEILNEIANKDSSHLESSNISAVARNGATEISFDNRIKDLKKSIDLGGHFKNAIDENSHSGLIELENSYSDGNVSQNASLNLFSGSDNSEIGLQTSKEILGERIKKQIGIWDSVRINVDHPQYTSSIDVKNAIDMVVKKVEKEIETALKMTDDAYKVALKHGENHNELIQEMLDGKINVVAKNAQSEIDNILQIATTGLRMGIIKGGSNEPGEGIDIAEGSISLKSSVINYSSPDTDDLRIFIDSYKNNEAVYYGFGATDGNQKTHIYFKKANNELAVVFDKSPKVWFPVVTEDNELVHKKYVDERIPKIIGKDNVWPNTSITLKTNDEEYSSSTKINGQGISLINFDKNQSELEFVTKFYDNETLTGYRLYMDNADTNWGMWITYNNISNTAGIHFDICPDVSNDAQITYDNQLVTKKYVDSRIPAGDDCVKINGTSVQTLKGEPIIFQNKAVGFTTYPTYAGSGDPSEDNQFITYKYFHDNAGTKDSTGTVILKNIAGWVLDGAVGYVRGVLTDRHIDSALNLFMDGIGWVRSGVSDLIRGFDFRGHEQETPQGNLFGGRLLGPSYKNLATPNSGIEVLGNQQQGVMKLWAKRPQLTDIRGNISQIALDESNLSLSRSLVHDAQEFITHAVNLVDSGINIEYNINNDNSNQISAAFLNLNRDSDNLSWADFGILTNKPGSPDYVRSNMTINHDSLFLTHETERHGAFISVGDVIALIHRTSEGSSEIRQYYDLSKNGSTMELYANNFIIDSPDSKDLSIINFNTDGCKFRNRPEIVTDAKPAARSLVTLDECIPRDLDVEVTSNKRLRLNPGIITFTSPGKLEFRNPDAEDHYTRIEADSADRLYIGCTKNIHINAGGTITSNKPWTVVDSTGKRNELVTYEINSGTKNTGGGLIVNYEEAKIKFDLFRTGQPFCLIMRRHQSPASDLRKYKDSLIVQEYDGHEVVITESDWV